MTTISRHPSELAPVLTSSIEFAEFVMLSTVALALPLFLRHPQFLVGSCVNICLILASLHMSSAWRILPLIILPSISAVLGGFLFGSDVAAGLILLWPMIWLGNGVLVMLMRRLRLGPGGNYFPTLMAAAFLKTAIIASGVLLLAATGVIPAFFAGAFLLMQLTTALCGGLLARPVAWAIERSISKR